MIKYKFIIVLLIAVVGISGWGYSTYQLQIAINNNTAMSTELGELREINAEQKRVADMLEAQIQAEKDDEAAMQAEFERLNRRYEGPPIPNPERKRSINMFEN